MRVCESQAWLKPVKRKPQEGWCEKFEGGRSVKQPKTQYAFTHDMLALNKKKKKKQKKIKRMHAKQKKSPV